jgi:membrane-associated phospholipid phosphatase
MDAPRPILAEQVNSGEWHSFPSGDVSATTTIVVVLLGLLARPQRWRWLLLVPLLVAFQRVIAARHFPADVLAGGMLGAWVGQQILRRIPPYQDWRSLPRRRAKVPVHDPT